MGAHVSTLGRWGSTIEVTTCPPRGGYVDVHGTRAERTGVGSQCIRMDLDEVPMVHGQHYGEGKLRSRLLDLDPVPSRSEPNVWSRRPETWRRAGGGLSMNKPRDEWKAERERQLERERGGFVGERLASIDREPVDRQVHELAKLVDEMELGL
jgi:hypothetical protein